jgi:hypothetical protein
VSYSVAGELGPMRDAIAMIRAALAEDREAIQVLLDDCDLREVAITLASYGAATTEAGKGGQEAADAWLAEVQATLIDEEREGGSDAMEQDPR